MGRRWRAALVGALLSCAAPIGSATADLPVGPGARSGFWTFDAEPALQGNAPLADFPSGMNVWVLSGTPHAAAMATAVAYAVGQLRRYGIDVRFKGTIRKPADITGIGNSLGFGTVSVTEAPASSSELCAPDVGAGPGVLTEGASTPYLTDVGTVRRIDRSEVTFCPAAWRTGSPGLVAIALHEMGHAVGLGHYRGRYHGTVQVMNPIVPEFAHYQAGDINGLRYLAAQTARLRADTVLRGAVESWAVLRSGLALQGWAITGRTDQYTNIEVTRDGKPVRVVAANGLRADIAAQYHALRTQAGFDIGGVPMLAGVHTYCAFAQNAVDRGLSRQLGCRQLSYPPAAAAQTPSAAQSTPSTEARAATPSSSSAAVVGGGVVGAVVVIGLGLMAARRRARR